MLPHFKILYITHYKKVFGTCLAILKNPHLAEEVTQEAFVKAYEKIETLKHPAKFGAWVAAIALKESLNTYNRGKKLVFVEREEILDVLADAEDISQNPYFNVEKLELTNEVQNAVSKLASPLNHVIILKYYWELSDTEIAGLLNIPLGTVKSSIYRAKKLLAKDLFHLKKANISLVKEEAELRV